MSAPSTSVVSIVGNSLPQMNCCKFGFVQNLVRQVEMAVANGRPNMVPGTIWTGSRWLAPNIAGTKYWAAKVESVMEKARQLG